jgi:serine/threonine protein kinase
MAERTERAMNVDAAARDPQNVFGRYVRLSELGRGGFGTVWLAWDRDLSRAVAMKFLHGQTPEDLFRFQREARTAAALAHPGIVHVHDVGESRGQPFIVMEYVEGKPADETELAPRQAVEVVRQAAEAVHFAHAQGIIHRDLKPANLIVEAGDPPRARVTDFGLAKSLKGEASLSLTGEITGT